MKHKLMIIALIALMALVAMPVQALPPCGPPAGYNSTYFMGPGGLGYCTGATLTNANWSSYGGYGITGAWYTPNYTIQFTGTATSADPSVQSTFMPLNATPGEYIMAHMRNQSDTCQLYTDYFFKNATGCALPPTAAFTGEPASGAAPLYVLFNDTSTNEFGTCTYTWTIEPAGGVSAGATGTMENHAASFSVPGLYNVSHSVSCPAGLDFENKTDYITTAFAAMDSPRWVQLAGANMHLLDVENGSWTNATPSLTGYLEITTLSNHTIDAYAEMLGYGDADLLAQPAWGGGTYTILMYPDGYANVSAGNVTLYVTVYASDADRLAGASVEVTYEPWAENIKQSVTDSSGMVQFTVPNQSTIYIAASKQGYTGLATSVDSGTGSGGDAAVYTELTLQRNFLTPTATQTTLPGGGTPTPEVTVLPGCEDPDSPECTAARQQFMADDVTEQLMEFMPLFWLAILIGLVKLIFKGW